MIHEPLPECIDRLARIETALSTIQENHLVHMDEELKELRKNLRQTNRFIITQIIGFGVLVIGALLQILLQ